MAFTTICDESTMYKPFNMVISARYNSFYGWYFHMCTAKGCIDFIPAIQARTWIKWHSVTSRVMERTTTGDHRWWASAKTTNDIMDSLKLCFECNLKNNARSIFSLVAYIWQRSSLFSVNLLFYAFLIQLCCCWLV